jgi:hypothetical protein
VDKGNNENEEYDKDGVIKVVKLEQCKRYRKKVSRKAMDTVYGTATIVEEKPSSDYITQREG